MNTDDLLEVIKALRLTVERHFQSVNWTSPADQRRSIRQINNMYEQINLMVEETVAKDIALSYQKGYDSASMEVRDRQVEIKKLQRHHERLQERAVEKGSHGIDVFAGTTGLGLDTPFKQGAGRDLPFNLGSRVHLNAVAELSFDAMMDLQSAINTTAENTVHSVNSALGKVSEKLQGGVMMGKARKEITKEVTNQFFDSGMRAFRTRDGKWLPLDFYAETVTRTKLKEAHTQGAVNRYKETGHDLVKVSGHNPTCHHCWNYQGVVFSVSGEDIRFPSASSSMKGAQDNLPPYHPNCMCSVNVWPENFMSEEEIQEAMNDGRKHEKNVRWGEDTRSDEMKDEYKEDQARKRRRNAEKKDYAKMKAQMGDDAPATLGAYRRMKHANTDNWQIMRKNYLNDIRPLVPFKVIPKKYNYVETRAQAEKYAQRLMNAKRVDFQHLPPTVLNEINEGLTMFLNDFPEMRGFTDNIMTEENTRIFARYRTGFNKQYKDGAFTYYPESTMSTSNLGATERAYDTLYSYYKNNEDKGFGLPSDNPISTAIHEMSHGIENYLTLNGRAELSAEEYNRYVPYKNANTKAEEILNTAVGRLGLDDYDKDNYIDEWGTYARKTPGETMSQAIASAMTGDNPNPLAVEIYNITKEEVVKTNRIIQERAMKQKDAVKEAKELEAKMKAQRKAVQDSISSKYN